MLQFQPRGIRAQEEPAFDAIVLQAKQRSDPHVLVRADGRMQVAVGGQRCLDLVQTSSLPVGEVGRFQATGVVLVLGLALGMGGGLMGRGQHGLGDFTVGFEGSDDLLLKGGLIHGPGL